MRNQIDSGFGSLISQFDIYRLKPQKNNHLPLQRLQTRKLLVPCGF
jgi:hypothetical protein